MTDDDISIFEARKRAWESGELFKFVMPEFKIDSAVNELSRKFAELATPQLGEFAKRLEELRQPTELTRWLEELQRPTELSRWFEELGKPAGLTQWITEFQKPTALSEWLEQLTQPTELTRTLQKMQLQLTLLKNAGWLPHYTIPFGMVDEFLENPDALGQTISDHYQSKWTETRQTLLDNIDRYFIDEESKEVFREAIKLHELGGYRAIATMLFPAIERLARIELHGNKMRGITSVPRLKEQAGNIPPSAITFNGFYGLEFFTRLMDHLYQDVNENNLAEFEEDPIPNRHAALHGFVIYKSRQSSLNMLFMADFLFQIFSVLRKNSNGSGEPLRAESD